MTEKSLTDFEEARQEMRECAEKVWADTRKKMSRMRRGIVIGWSCLVGWLLFMLAAGISISEKIHPGIFWGLALAGVVVMILRHRSLRKRSLALYQQTCLVPLFRSLGDWISYEPEKGIEREELQQSLIPDELLVKRDLEGLLEKFQHAGSGWVLIKPGHRSRGENLVKGELLGVSFETAPTVFEETLYGGSSLGVNSAHRTAFFMIMDKAAPVDVVIVPNVIEKLRDALPGMLTHLVVNETSFNRLSRQVSFEEEDWAFHKAFIVLSQDPDAARALLGPEVRASLKELAGDIGLIWPGVTIRKDKVLLLESTPNPLFAPDHPERMNFPARADEWLELLARCIMLTKEIESSVLTQRTGA